MSDVYNGCVSSEPIVVIDLLSFKPVFQLTARNSCRLCGCRHPSSVFFPLRLPLWFSKGTTVNYSIHPLFISREG
jgi:hypothetical protein